MEWVVIFFSPGNLPIPEIEPLNPHLLLWQEDSLPLEPHHQLQYKRKISLKKIYLQKIHESVSLAPFLARFASLFSCSVSSVYLFLRFLEEIDSLLAELPVIHMKDVLSLFALI